MLAVQTDDRALWIDSWRSIALAALDTDAVRNHPQRAEFRKLLLAWNGRADADAVGYRLLRDWLGAPRDPLPGDINMPRLQAPSFGASERMVVSPGREQDGIFEMPGGESGHPPSPYFLAGHEAWVHAEATPFLPGVAVHQLELVPQSQ